MSIIIENPDIEVSHEELSDAHGDGWAVVVYNNDYNTYDEVIHILMVATGCGFDEAYCETWEIDHYGKASVHFGSKTECDRVAGIIRSIGLQVEVIEE